MRSGATAFTSYGVLLGAVESVPELVSLAVLASPRSAADFASELPAQYLRRMQQHRVSPQGQQYWTDLCGGL